MAEFIEVHEKGEERLVNLSWGEEVRSDEDGSAVIYFAFQGNGSFEQDCIKADESYADVMRLIWR